MRVGALPEELVEFQETERKMLSLERHDGMAQELATLWLYLQTGRHKLEPTEALLGRCLGVVERMTGELKQRMYEASFCQVVVSKYGDRLHGTVTDDGRGFDPLEMAGKGRLGIVGMRDRCEFVGGRLEVQSKPGSGTAVSFEVTGRGTA